MKYFLFILIFLCPIFSLAIPDTTGQAQRKSDSIFYAKSRLASSRAKKLEELHLKNQIQRQESELHHQKFLRTLILVGGLVLVAFIVFLIIFLIKKFS